MAGMTRATSAVVGGWILLGMSAVAVAQGAGSRSAVTLPAPALHGVLRGVVVDEKGVPLAGAIVSATGIAAAFDVTDDKGRFELRDLPPGTYSLRARLPGFTESQPQTIDVLANTQTQSAVALHRSSPPVLAAGFGADPDVIPVKAVAAADADAGSSATDADETAWRLRHTRRTVLKDSDIASDLAGDDQAPNFFSALDYAERAAGASLHLASDFITDTQFTGAVNLLTTGSLESPRDLFAANAMSHGIAFLSLTAPAGSKADWTVRGAFTQADISAWIISGSYKTRESSDRPRDFGVAYSTQRYDGGNPVALSAVTDGSRNVGEIYGFETSSPVSGVSVSYGARYAQYDYLDGRNLISPRVEVTIAPASNLRVIGSVSSRALAPGAEEFLPPSENGIWLPPQRTFSSLDPSRPLTAEHTLSTQLGVKRTVGHTTLGMRAFHQRIDDQLVTLFGADIPNQPSVKVGHYFVGSAGDAKATGGAASIETEIGGRIRGSVEYSLASARLRLLDDLRYMVFMGPTTGRPFGEYIHDVSATVRATVPETSTNVLIVYRIGNSFAHGTQEVGLTSAHRAFDSRFDVQVRQSLPFMDFRTARWEMLVAVRNFFRETAFDQSIYDELLVVRPPKRVVGGLTMMF
jgi:hypothetical protein